ncbi:MAG: HAD family hydrolase [Bacteroidales bacterium]|nr:HAD family hydrolase [Bacteroidales bacterium]
MDRLEGFATIFIDADDTLWENEGDFRLAEERFADLLAPVANVEDVRHMLWEKQEDNIPHFGYGSKTYLIGMLDAAFDLSGGRLDYSTFKKIREIIIKLATHPLHIIDGVEETLACLSQKYRLVLATKGDSVEQTAKYRKSGLMKYFFSAEVMMNKREEDYLEIASKYGVSPEKILMVGNSVKSDIIPIINLGGTAILLPSTENWVHEAAEVPDSDRVISLGSFSELKNIL